MEKVAAFQFDWNGKITLLTLLFLPLLITLGFWQLNRAEQKKILQQEYQKQQAQAPVLLEEIKNAPANKTWNFRRVRAEGQLDRERYWLLENQFQHGRLGYHVLMPLRTHDGPWLLVNRGWIEAQAYRDNLPEIHTPNGPIIVEGYLASPVDNLLIQPVDAPLNQWPQVILEIDVLQMEQQLQRPLWPKILRLEEQSAAALDVLWQPINTRPAKHLGYAVQWFTMAVVLSILWLFANSNIYEWLRIKWMDCRN